MAEPSVSPRREEDGPDAASAIQHLKENITKVFLGAERVVDHLLVALLAGGHALIEDVPGVGKTTLARALARSIDCAFQRIQFTPDLLPGDIIGVSLYDPTKGEFVFRPGPVFTNILLADEINRTPPRTQSALLEAMNEKQVSVDGRTRRLDPPFMVLATMNPLEHHGTYDLPESQLDRFLLRLTIGYPGPEGERRIFRAQKKEHPLDSLGPVVSGDDVLDLMRRTRGVRIAPPLEDYVLTLVQGTRDHPEVLLGASPRATLDLFRSSQARALLSGRSYVAPDDIKEMALPVLAHRIVLRESSPDDVRHQVLRDILERTAVPE